MFFKSKITKGMGISLLLSAILSITASCGNDSVSSSSNDEVESNIITTTTESEQTTTTLSTSTESTECTTSETTTDSAEYAERQIVEAICIDLHGGMFEPYTVLGENSKLIEYENDADYLIQNAKTISERCLGNISDKEDAIEKARAVWKEILDAKYIEKVESEYVDVDGVKMKYERRKPPYAVKYYEEYDVWYVVPTAPSGTREDGVSFDVIWDCPPYLLIRGEDGMILGSF